jgi:cobalt-zinc-cadmium efflux system protein
MFMWISLIILVMPHDHSHHSHSHQLELDKGNKKALLFGISLNIAFVGAELVGGFLYDSMALLTDAGHNAGDVATLI